MYILSAQVVEIQYEGIRRYFSVVSVSRRAGNSRNSASDISGCLSTLTINDVSSLYIVDWDTTIALEDKIQVSGSNPSEVRTVLYFHIFFHLI